MVQFIFAQGNFHNFHLCKDSCQSFTHISAMIFSRYFTQYTIICTSWVLITLVSARCRGSSYRSGSGTCCTHRTLPQSHTICDSTFTYIFSQAMKVKCITLTEIVQVTCKKVLDMHYTLQHRWRQQAFDRRCRSGLQRRRASGRRSRR